MSKNLLNYCFIFNKKSNNEMYKYVDKFVNELKSLDKGYSDYCFYAEDGIFIEDTLFIPYLKRGGEITLQITLRLKEEYFEICIMGVVKKIYHSFFSEDKEYAEFFNVNVEIYKINYRKFLTELKEIKCQLIKKIKISECR